MPAAAEGPFWLGIDLGGTNVKAGVVTDAGGPLSSVSEPTEAEKGPEHGISRLCQAGRHAVEKSGLKLSDIAGVGVGSPGPLDLREQIIINPGNLPGWVNVPLARKVGEQLGLPGVLQNDANAAAYAEYWAGAGRSAESLVQFTLGTGIGCGIVVNDRVLEGRHSHAAEAGHARLSVLPVRPIYSGFGTLEGFASATAVVRRAREALGERFGLPDVHGDPHWRHRTSDWGVAPIEAFDPGPPGSTPPGEQDGSLLKEKLSQGKELTAELVFACAKAGDAMCRQLVENTAYYLAVGAVNVIQIVDPDMVVFSGGMIHAGKPFLDAIGRFVEQIALPVPAAAVEVRYAELGADAGFIGAAGCARSRFATSPSSPTSTTARAP